MENSNRRGFLKATAGIGGAAVLGGPALSGCVAQTGDGNDPEFGQILQGNNVKYDKIILSDYFTVEVHGMYEKVPGVVSIDPGKVGGIDPTQNTDRGDRAEYKLWCHGDHEYQDATLTVMQAPGMVKLQKWVDKAMKVGGTGDALRRDVSLYLLARDKSTVLKTVNMFGCYPTDFDAGDESSDSETKTITLTLNVDRIEVA